MMKIQDQEDLLEKGLIDVETLEEDQLVLTIHILIEIICKEKRNYYEYLEIIRKINNNKELLKVLCHRISFIKFLTLLNCLKREKFNFENGIVEICHLDDIYFNDWISFIFEFYLGVSRSEPIRYILIKLIRLKRKIVSLISFDIAVEELPYTFLFNLTEFLQKMKEIGLWSDIIHILDSIQFDLSLYQVFRDNGQMELFEELRCVSKEAYYYEKKRSEKRILWVQISIVLCFIFITAIFPMYIYTLENFRYSNRISFFDSIYLSVMNACSVGVS